MNWFLSLVGAVVVDDLSAPTGRVCVCVAPPRCAVRTGWDAHVAPGRGTAAGTRTAPLTDGGHWAETYRRGAPPAVKNAAPRYIVVVHRRV